MTSLRRRLVLVLVIGLLVGGAAGGMGFYWQAVEELGEMFDDRLVGINQALNPQTFEAAGIAAEKSDEDGEDIVIQHWGADGRLLYHSSVTDRAPRPQASGLRTLETRAGWRSYSRAMPDGTLLQTAQALSARRELAAGTALRMLLPFGLLLPALAAFMAWTVSRQLHPLRALARHLQRRKVLEISAISVPDAPAELAPVVDALNQLLTRQAQAAQQRQVFLADAAHELRTPLAVVSLQAQRVQDASTYRDRREANQALQQGVERTNRLVSQLLALARSESAVTALQLAPLDLEQRLREWLAALIPLAEAKGVDLGLISADTCTLLADREGLRSAITNLVDNALRHTPSGGRVDVSLRVVGRVAVLTVADTGPGIPAAMRKTMFDRFAQGAYGDNGGSGLGLAIVHRVVDQHGGKVELEGGEAGTGLLVQVSLPVA